MMPAVFNMTSTKLESAVDESAEIEVIGSSRRGVEARFVV
jgi:hypothetical protein